MSQTASNCPDGHWGHEHGKIVHVLVQVVVPAWVFLGVRRHFDDPCYTWVHVAAMPASNALGLLGYVEERLRVR